MYWHPTTSTRIEFRYLALAVCRCMLTGPCLASHVCIGGPQELSLHTYDSYGNARATGGEEVAVEITGPAGTQIRKAAVADRGNGCYGVSFQPDREGRWLLTPRCTCKRACAEAPGSSPDVPGSAL